MTDPESTDEPGSGESPAPKKTETVDDPSLSSQSQATEAAPTAPPVPRAVTLPSFDTSGLGKLAAWALTLLGLLLPLIVMANDRRWTFSPYLGFAGCGLAAFGLMRLLGCFKAQAPLERGAASSLRPLLTMLMSGGVFIGCVRMAVAGVYPLQQVVAPVLITSSFIWLVVALFRFAQSIGLYGPEPDGTVRPLRRRHGFWLVLVSTLVSLPTLGVFGLIDPWETHYGEVAREMLSRDDWVSLWWAHDGWFWSKPILNFWIQGLSFKLFGVHYMPDQMLSGVESGRLPQPEWACRIPILLITLVASYSLYRASMRPLGRRAAMLGGLVLTTCPYWYLLARQTMADMPYVAPLCVAMAFLMLGFQTDPERKVRDLHLRLGRFECRLNGVHLLFGAVLLCLLPQVLYLYSRNFTFHTTDDLFGFRPHLDEIFKGSGGDNCGQPGNKKCGDVGALYKSFWAQPAFLASIWLSLGLGFLWLRRKERRLQRLYFIAAWFCTAIAVMAKGAPGLVLPVGAALSYALITGRVRDVLRLELPALFVLLLAVAFPWYVQMFMRHGMPFIDRLILHDMVKRAFNQVHHTNEGDDLSFRYYVWQLGYGLFPWTGLAAGGLLWWGTRRRSGDRPFRNTTLFLLVWWLMAFGMFSITLTKFHHYIFPLVPPTAMLAGVLLARVTPENLAGSWKQNAAYVGSLFTGVTLLFLAWVAYFPGNLDGIATNGELPPAQPWLGIALAVSGLVALVVGTRRFGKIAHAPDNDKSDNATLGVIAIAAAVGVGLAGRDMFTTRQGDVDGQARILHLFTYNYGRDYPTVLDFNPAIAALTALAVVMMLLLAVPRIRHHAGVMVMSLGGVSALWCIGIYLVQLSPHWGQRETMVAFYQRRDDESQSLVAYQMNWKGENFYTGNRMATFVSSGKKFKRWVKKQRKKGVRTMFFTTEHTRLKSLKRELDQPEGFEQLTDKDLNNKFFLARVDFPPLSDAELKEDEDDKPAKSKSKAKAKAKPNKKNKAPSTKSGSE